MMELNAEQKWAVECPDKKIVCLAGAGAGKTAVLVSRVSRLVREGVDPSSILVLTFTKAAAMEMRERFYRMNGRKGQSPDFRTFHSFCYSMLQRRPAVRKALGYTDIPVIADTAQEKKVRESARLQVGSKLTDRQMTGKDNLTPREKYELEVLIKAQKRLMKAQNIITFDILSSEVTSLFIKDDPSVKPVKETIKYIFADENQDTNKIESDFMMSFTDASFFVVGDSLQNLYSFRGSDNSIMRSYVDSDDWTTIKLYRNYRSARNICDYANKLTAGYAKPQYRIELQASRPGGKICEHDYERDYNYDIKVPEAPMEWMLENVPTMEGTTAILARTNAEVGEIRQAFDDKGIPFVSHKRDDEAKNILLSVADNEYFLDYVTLYLNKSQYYQYLRSKEIDQPDNPLEYVYNKFQYIPHIKYRMDTVVGIRKVLRSEDFPNEKAKQIFKLLGMKDVEVDTDARTPREILDYVTNRLEEVVSSDIYIGTIHSVKGLEYDNVVLFGVNGESFRLNGEDMFNLFYVGITRAKNRLDIFYGD